MNKRIIILLSIAMLCVGVASAKEVSEKKAAAIAQTFFADVASAKGLWGNDAQSVKLKLAYTAKSASDDSASRVYVFNRENNGGYVFVSADDRVASVLGYSDSGEFSYTDAPANMKAWLAEYARQIDYAIEKGITHTAGRKTNKGNVVVKPLLENATYNGYKRSILWNQDAPYNKSCPTIEVNNGRRTVTESCVTGCVATSMAQVLAYNHYPDHGVGSHSYKWNGNTLSADFSGATYDWNTIYSTDPSYYKYSSDYENAVSLVSYHCGVAVEMEYDSPYSGGSAASSYAIAGALVRNFGYDAATMFAERTFYSDEDWTAMVKNELDNGRPLIYDGATASGSGHSFVCDGYTENDYFHINWGWGKGYNGYYLLSALKPETQSFGGAEEDEPFSYEQDIIIGIQPPVEGSKMKAQLCGMRGLPEIEETLSKGDYLGLVTFSRKDTVEFYNFSYGAIDVDVDYVLFDSSDKAVTRVSEPEFTEMNTLEGFQFASSSRRNDYAMEIPENLADGNYTIRFCFREKGETAWHNALLPYGEINHYNLTVNGNTVTVASTASQTTGISAAPRMTDGKGGANAGIYDINGNKLSSPKKGVNIIKQKDGKTRKVIVR